MESLDWRFWSKVQSSSSCNVNKTVHVKQYNTAAMTWTFYTTFTKLLLAYTGLYYTWCDNIIQKTIKGVFRRNQTQSGSIRNHPEASGMFRKHQNRQGDQPRLGGQAIQGEQTRQGDKAGQGDQPRLWGQALQKEQAGQGYQAKQGHQPWLRGGPSMESRLGRESSLSRETSLWWEGRLCRESWLGIAYSNRCIYHFNPNSSPPLNLHDASWSFLVLFEASWPILTDFA